MTMDFKTDETTEYFDNAPTAEWHPLDGAVEEWCRGDMETRAESPKARRI